MLSHTAVPMYFWTNSHDLKKEPAIKWCREKGEKIRRGEVFLFNQIHWECDSHQIATRSNLLFCDFMILWDSFGGFMIVWDSLGDFITGYWSCHVMSTWIYVDPWLVGLGGQSVYVAYEYGIICFEAGTHSSGAVIRQSFTCKPLDLCL